MTDRADNQKTLEDLARVKAIFQQRTIVAILNERPALLSQEETETW